MWKKGHQLRGFPDTEAKADLLECVYSYIKKKHAEVPVEDCIVDVGESTGRVLRGGKAEFRRMPLLSTNTEVYSYGLDRCLVAEDTYSLISTRCYLLLTAGSVLLSSKLLLVPTAYSTMLRVVDDLLRGVVYALLLMIQLVMVNDSLHRIQHTTFNLQHPTLTTQQPASRIQQTTFQVHLETLDSGAKYLNVPMTNVPLLPAATYYDLLVVTSCIESKFQIEIYNMHHPPFKIWDTKFKHVPIYRIIYNQYHLTLEGVRLLESILDRRYSRRVPKDAS